MWYEDPRWQRRLTAEQAVMRERFPQFRLVRSTDGSLRWVGQVEPVFGERFLLSIRYPAQYPYEPPRLLVEDPQIRPGAPHRYHDQTLCIHRRHWDPERGTAASCVPLASAWLVAYTVWLRTGETF